MNEAIKTVIYAGVAILVACIAYFTRPADVEFTDSTIREQVNKPLFPEFKDPKAAARLEIVQVKSDLGSVNKFEVARDKDTDLWSIPSHAGYPADAENQMRDVSLMFVDLEIRGIASTVADDHRLFGVLEPEQSSSSEAEGVGMMVNVLSRDGDKLANLIIGKPVKDSQDERFVRKPGQDVVYVVAIDPSKLSTKFEDWIEKDLLQLNGWDIENVSLLDYSIVETNRPGVLGLDQRLQVDLKWDSAKSEWLLNQFLTYQGREAVPTQMGIDESLNTTKLNELKSALDDLEIVDVFRKPAGMTADLKANEEFLSNEAKASLDEKGFYVVPTGPSTLEIKSANGEVHVAMKDGVRYVLRFGNTLQSATAGKVDRFMFVMAEFDESRFPLPELPAGLIPTTPPGPASPVPDGAQPAAEQPAADKPADDKPAAEPPAEDKPAAENPPGGCVQEQPAQPAAPAAQDPAAQPAATTPAAEGQPPATPPAGAVPPENEAQAAERERLLKEHQRLLDERNEKIEQGKQRVRELNGRFADWYYVISDEFYRKIHLGRSDIFVTKPGTAEEGFGVDSFRQLEQQGLSKPGPAIPGLEQGN